jgi:hypothetical protein
MPGWHTPGIEAFRRLRQKELLIYSDPVSKKKKILKASKQTNNRKEETCSF